jgi:hypothetical protein
MSIASRRVSLAPLAPLPVAYTVGGTAKSGVDYEALPGTPGAVSAATLELRSKDR